jgi:cell division protein FtsB
LSPTLKCRFLYLLIFWAFFSLWAFHSYFFGENSLSTLSELERTYKVLERERDYWKFRNEVLLEKLTSLEANKDYYYHKLGRELFVRGKEGERVILFVK